MIIVQLPTPSDDFQGALITALEDLIRQIPEPMMTGAIQEFITLPDGWLEADGTTFSELVYPELYRVLGGTTLPNLTPQYVGTVVGIKT